MLHVVPIFGSSRVGRRRPLAAGPLLNFSKYSHSEVLSRSRWQVRGPSSRLRTTPKFRRVRVRRPQRQQRCRHPGQPHRWFANCAMPKWPFCLPWRPCNLPLLLWGSRGNRWATPWSSGSPRAVLPIFLTNWCRSLGAGCRVCIFEGKNWCFSKFGIWCYWV